MRNKLYLSTVAAVSAITLVSATGYGQPRGSEQVQQATQNFYITTPQTGERTSAGNAGSVSTSAGSEGTLNTYTGTTTWQANQANSAKASSRQPTRSASRSTKQNNSTQYQTAAASYSPQSSSVNASAQQVSNNYNTYYQSSANQQTAQQAIYPSYVAHASAQPTQQEKKGVLSRLLHRKQDTNTQPQIQQVSNSIKSSKYTGTVQSGSASWYGSDFHGGKTASGERYNMETLTAAHRTLPFGTLVKVKNERNGRECVVRINNRGPFIKGRILDVSKAAARQLGMVTSGVAKIKMEVLGRS